MNNVIKLAGKARWQISVLKIQWYDECASHHITSHHITSYHRQNLTQNTRVSFIHSDLACSCSLSSFYPSEHKQNNKIMEIDFLGATFAKLNLYESLAHLFSFHIIVLNVCPFNIITRKTLKLWLNFNKLIILIKITEILLSKC